MAREEGFYWVKAHHSWPKPGYHVVVARLVDRQWLIPGSEEWVDEDAMHGSRVEVIGERLVEPEVT